jgi:hypothetical protein
MVLAEMSRGGGLFDDILKPGTAINVYCERDNGTIPKNKQQRRWKGVVLPDDEDNFYSAILLEVERPKLRNGEWDPQEIESAAEWDMFQDYTQIFLELVDDEVDNGPDSLNMKTGGLSLLDTSDELQGYESLSEGD